MNWEAGMTELGSGMSELGSGMKWELELVNWFVG